MMAPLRQVKEGLDRLPADTSILTSVVREAHLFGIPGYPAGFWWTLVQKKLFGK